MMVMALLVSKVVLGSMAFVYIPYFFPLALIGDFLIILIYNKLCFGVFNGSMLDFKKMLITNSFEFQ